MRSFEGNVNQFLEFLYRSPLGYLYGYSCNIVVVRWDREGWGFSK